MPELTRIAKASMAGLFVVLALAGFSSRDYALCFSSICGAIGWLGWLTVGLVTEREYPISHACGCDEALARIQLGADIAFCEKCGCTILSKAGADRYRKAPPRQP